MANLSAGKKKKLTATSVKPFSASDSKGHPDSSSNREGITEEVVSGETAQTFFNLLVNPPNDPVASEFMKAAVKKFPNPTEPMVLDLDL
jgi:hypothetical protein